MRLYVDDVLLYTTINSHADCLTLQQDLDLLQKQAEDWQMQFNLITKYDFLRITKRKCPIVASHTTGKCVIQEVSHIKYLGVTIDSQLPWNEHVKATTKKANAVKGFLHWNISSGSSL